MPIEFKQLQDFSEKIYEKVNTYREHLHSHPELSYKEYKTAKFVSETLSGLGIENASIGETGVVAVISANGHTENTPCLGLRADLDALPIQEENEVSYRSQNDGVMHACGHDVHTSILLGVAEVLQHYREELPMPVKLIFQPGEERNPGGATYVIRDGGLENPKVDKMAALHVFPDLDYGHFGFKEGLYMASCDELHIEVQGLGGHGALPERTVNPLFMGADFILQARNYIMENTPKEVPSVINFGKFDAKGSTNVIPEKAFIKGTFRTMDESWRVKAKKDLMDLAQKISEEYNGQINLNISDGYPYLKNDEDFTNSVRELAESHFGKEVVHHLPIRMTSEDFAYYSQLVPVCFFRLGVRNEEKGITNGLHTSKFDIDQRSMQKGVLMLSMIAFSSLK